MRVRKAKNDKVKLGPCKFTYVTSGWVIVSDQDEVVVRDNLMGLPTPENYKNKTAALTQLYYLQGSL